MGFAGGVGDGVVGAVEVGPLVVEERPHDLDALGEPVDPGLGRLQLDAVDGVLVDLPAGTETEHEASVGDVIDRRRPVGQQGGMVDRRRRDQRPEPNPIGQCGQTGQDRPRLMAVALDRLAVGGIGHVMIGEPDRRPRRVAVGQLGQVDHLVPAELVVNPHRYVHGNAPSSGFRVSPLKGG